VRATRQTGECVRVMRFGVEHKCVSGVQQ